LVSCFQTGSYAPGYNCNDTALVCFCFSGLWPEIQATRYARWSLTDRAGDVAFIGLFVVPVLTWSAYDNAFAI
jgi:hypothetical protein